MTDQELFAKHPDIVSAFEAAWTGKNTAPTPIDELFERYRAEVKKNLAAKVLFGEHQRLAFEAVVGGEIERLRLTSRSQNLR